MTDAAQIVSHIFNEYDSPEWEHRISFDLDLDEMLLRVEDFTIDEEELEESAKRLLIAWYRARTN